MRTKNLLILSLLFLSITAATAAYACMAFYEDESVNGSAKICYYNHLGDTVAHTVRSYEICPLNIQVSH